MKCGVSVSTVSRAINNHPEISVETREFILDTIKSMGYSPNESARNLKRIKSNTIAVLIKGIDNPFFQPMFKVIEHEINQNEYSFLLYKVEELDDELEVAVKLVNEVKPEGIIFLGGGFKNTAQSHLNAISVPFVVVSMINKLLKNDFSSYIGVDDFLESKRIVDYLISLGHQKIAIIGSRRNDVSVGRQRIEGYLEALTKAQITIDEKLIITGNEEEDPYTFEYGYRMADKLLEMRTDFTAIYCISDTIAIGALKRLQEREIKVPADCSVVGFDGLKINEYLPQSITTIKQPVEEMALRACKELFHIINGDEFQKQVVFDAQLWIGSTTSTIRQPNQQGETQIERSNTLKNRLQEVSNRYYGRELHSLSKEELFNLLVGFTKEEIQNKPRRYQCSARRQRPGGRRQHHRSDGHSGRLCAARVVAALQGRRYQCHHGRLRNRLAPGIDRRRSRAQRVRLVWRRHHQDSARLERGVAGHAHPRWLRRKDHRAVEPEQAFVRDGLRHHGRPGNPQLGAHVRALVEAARRRGGVPGVHRAGPGAGVHPGQGGSCALA